MRIERIAFDNENPTGEAAAAAEVAAAEVAAAEAAAAADAAAAKAATAALKSTEKTFTQKEVDDIVVKRQKTLKGQFEQLESRYTTLLEEQNLTAEQRAQLESDLENVQGQMRTKEQNLEHEKKKSTEKHQTELAASNEERDFYRSLYQNSTIDREIADAASDNDGYNTSQFVSFLHPLSKMIDELSSTGEKTGRLVARVEWEVENEAGEREVMLKTPREVVELMKDDVDKYGNMFRSNVARGIGEGSAAGPTPATGNINHEKISTEEYMKLRKDPTAARQMGIIR